MIYFDANNLKCAVILMYLSEQGLQISLVMSKERLLNTSPTCQHCRLKKNNQSPVQIFDIDICKIFGFRIMTSGLNISGEKTRGLSKVSMFSGSCV